ncbi:MAG: sensor histidine kinase [Candidatus Geothermincolia bacterium]
MAELAGWQGTLSFISALLCFATGLYVISKNPRAPINWICGLLGLLLAGWAFGDTMVAISTTLESKIFWIRFQILGEMPLPSLYLTLALFFPERRRLVGTRPRAAAVLFAVFCPFLAMAALAAFTDLVYASFSTVAGAYGIIARPSWFFWLNTALGYMVAATGMLLLLQAYRRDRIRVARVGLLVVALAPLVLVGANVAQLILNHAFDISAVSTPHFAFLFAALEVYGILRYGLFLEAGAVFRRALLHSLGMLILMMCFVGSLLFLIFILEPTSPAFILIVCLLLLLALFAYPPLDRALGGKVGEAMALKRYRQREKLPGWGDSLEDFRGLRELGSSLTGAVKNHLGLDACGLLVSEEGGFFRFVSADVELAELLHLESERVELARVMEGNVAFTVFSDGGAIRSSWAGGVQYKRPRMSLQVLLPGQRPTDPNFEKLFSLRLDLESHGTGLLWMGKRGHEPGWTGSDLDELQRLEPRLSLAVMNAKLLEEVVRQRERLRALARRATQARESERARLSRELHDTASRFLLDVIFKLDMLDDGEAAVEVSAGAIQELKGRSKDVLQELRRVITDLRPPLLEVLGLARSLGAWTERFGRENGVRVVLALEERLPLQDLEEMTIYRIVQEGLTNVAKHADAREVRVSLKRVDSTVKLTVEDDGRGFDLAEMRRRQAAGEALGLRSMEERAMMFKGSFEVDSRPGQGTRLQICLPVDQSEEVAGRTSASRSS